MQHVKTSIRCVRAPVGFEDIPLSSNVANDEMFERDVMTVKRNVILHHKIQHTLNVLLRTCHDLFANVIRFKSNTIVPIHHSNIDILVIRENTEGEYRVHLNTRKLIDGLFIDCCREIAAEYPDIKFDIMIINNTCMQLVNRPTQCDVMVMPNLYGNMVSNVGAGLVAGSKYGEHYAIFQ
ncbi:unnamed protein product [Rotaria socialis]|uniref:Isopropylmalate dehydrogenase-like domain-containing protein n=1 Tax=Rotaria socialis TaxID=392032 RepID=A0A821JIJ2_9BILA|nr:unnamed protein product [Rotaria socialis]CAF4526640.1 unnamed protein product [Rotaria socialis]CAF4527599.1 unnamed protein product [Rotaria socialis]CAF4719137.1 unnamed protein product [Rotaria socialis]CAF4807760.1 unnamed protein product [Rotaria socialis]